MVLFFFHKVNIWFNRKLETINYLRKIKKSNKKFNTFTVFTRQINMIFENFYGRFSSFYPQRKFLSLYPKNFKKSVEEQP